MKKTGVAVVFLLAMLVFFSGGPAFAAYTKCLRTSREIPVMKRGPADFTGDTAVETGAACQWTICNETYLDKGYYYAYTMAVNDGTHSGGYNDILYISSRTQETGISYTFYEDGEYWLYADIYENEDDEEKDALTCLWLRITVTKGSGDNALTNAVEQAAQACRGDNEFETVVAINDWLCDHVTYDTTCSYYSAEAAILNGTGVCNSYARAYKLIAEACGLSCKRISGTGGGVGHAWNAVQMDGDWYQLDCTWNDFDGRRHLYLGMNDALMKREHGSAYYQNGESETCGTLNDNYFVKTGTWKNLALGVTGLQKALNASEDGMVTVDFGSTVYNEDGGIGVYDASVLYYNGSFVAWALGEETLRRPANGRTELLKGTFEFLEEDHVLSGTITVTETVVPEAFGEADFVLPEGITQIGTEALAGIAAASIDIPGGTEEEPVQIGADAFSGCSALMKIRVGEYTVADRYAFVGCCRELVVYGPEASAVRSVAEDAGITFAFEEQGD